MQREGEEWVWAGLQQAPRTYSSFLKKWWKEIKLLRIPLLSHHLGIVYSHFNFGGRFQRRLQGKSTHQFPTTPGAQPVALESACLPLIHSALILHPNLFCTVISRQKIYEAVVATNRAAMQGSAAQWSMVSFWHHVDKPTRSRTNKHPWYEAEGHRVPAIHTHHPDS